MTISKYIEDDLDWRHAELVSLKKLVSDADKDSVRQVALLRALWALLYAHYEGFCKYAWDLYLEFLQKEGVKRKDCEPHIIKLSLLKDFKEMRGDLSPTSIMDFCEKKYKLLLQDTIEFEIKLETESNLWPNLLRDNLILLGLPHVMVDTNILKLKTLVKRRNDIAHGKKMIIKNLEEYKKYEEAAFSVMYELALELVDSVEKKKHLKPSCSYCI